jgi:hypothetical protein
LKSLSTLSEAFSNAYPKNEVLNKKRVRRLVTKFQDTKVFVCDKRSSSDKIDEIKVVPISSIAPPATTGYG